MVSQSQGDANIGRRWKRPRLDADAGSPAARTPLPESPRKRMEDEQKQSATNTNPLRGSHLDALIDVYFSSVARWVPLVHEMTFRRTLQGQADSDPWPIVLHSMLVGALPILNAKQQLFSADELRSMVARARSRVILTASEGLSIEHLQSLVIVAFTHVSGWNVVCKYVSRRILTSCIARERRARESMALGRLAHTECRLRSVERRRTRTRCVNRIVALGPATAICRLD